MIVNFWVWGNPAYLSEVSGVARIRQEESGPDDISAEPVQVNATTYPLLNTVSIKTLEMFRFFPEHLTGAYPEGLWNCYLRGDSYSDFVATREDLQLLEDKYYPDFWVGGAWNVATGEPIGGVGSPWFRYPGDLLALMPNGVPDDIVLMAGQAKRKFV